MTDQWRKASANGTTPQANLGRGVALMVVSALLACAGQFCWKLGAGQGWLLIALGLVLYGCGAVVMIVAYRHGEVSTLQPILALSYVLSLVLGVVWLHEPVTLGRVLGVLAVIIGVVVIASGAPRSGARATVEPSAGHRSPAGPGEDHGSGAHA